MNTPDNKQPIFEKDDAPDATPPETQTGTPWQKYKKGLHSRREFLGLAAAFAAGFGGGYFLRELILTTPTDPSTTTGTAAELAEAKSENASAIDQLNLPAEYILPVTFGDIGPQLLHAGAIDYDGFVQIYEQAGQPLTQEQLAILSAGSAQPIVINRKNAYFLLNFFWALGLANKNPLPEKGPMVQYNEGNIEGFASTGGWTLATKPIPELYASAPIISLTPKQQTRLEEVAAGVYRPCCNNPTAFPDCNHGMAMLGALELMAAEDTTVDKMFTAAKNINAFWFPQQTLEIALVFQKVKGQDFVEADAQVFAGPNFSSGSGYGNVHQWLADNNLLEQAPNQGGNCGV